MRLLLLSLLLVLLPATAWAGSRADRIEARYGVGDIKSGDKDWTDAELKIVEASLERLSREELPGVKGVQLVRMRRSPRLFGTGLYKVDSEGPRILVYDRAFSGAGRGSASKPNQTLLHEFGHAIAHKAVRVATRRAERALAEANKGVEKYNDAVSQYNRLIPRYNETGDPKIKDDLVVIRRRVDRLAHDTKDLRSEYRKLSRVATSLHQDYRSPFPRTGVLHEYKGVLGWALGPTRYGRWNLQESFAESFMLHHCDAKALEKALPKVHVWLAGDGHLHPRR